MSAPVAALALLMAGDPNLPAPTVHMTTVYPDRLELSFYDEPTAFEPWCAALGIEPGTVEERSQEGGSTHVRKAVTSYGGATVRLISYTCTGCSQVA
ncbi:hypothetical protein FM076_16075 [Streptomyces albus subsp. chlorinus]|uniref:hypothetical protein n=1 Tax=Streptomyces albus TaxID=1888 RepID=UPI00156E0F46|nr:hypothetical protein [Streptomyces albus]NSC22606.1 hypothetical protein [Streptomyces albus subsp. chlorinus]